MNKDVMIACDFKDKETTLDFLADFKGQSPYLKIGMELFYGEGIEIVKELKAAGFKIFLDLKLHDIPTTVRKAMANVAKLGVDVVNLHASGGIPMMKEAIVGLEEGSVNNPRPLCIAVTQLTSTTEEQMHTELLINAGLNETVVHYSKNAKEAGLDGVVCSPLEVPLIKEACGLEFLTITPGIRQASDNKDDQKRVTTPSDARELGSDFIVVGRSITASKNPVESYLKIKEDFCGRE